MKLRTLFATLAAILAMHAHAQYNTLWIPDTLAGTHFDLTVKDTFRQILTGN